MPTDPGHSSVQNCSINPAATLMECNRGGRRGVVVSAGCSSASSVLARRLGNGVGRRGRGRAAPAISEQVADVPSGDLDLRALGQALMRKRGLIIAPTTLAAVIAIMAVNLVTPRYKSEAHPDRRARKRFPAAEWRAQRGARGARPGGRHQPGPAIALARSGARNHQEEQARRAPGIRSSAAGACAAEIAARAVWDRPRSIFADAGRARAGRLFRPADRVRRRQVARHRGRIPVARPRSGGACRQLDRRRLSGAAAKRSPGPGQIRQPVAVRRDRKSPPEGFRCRIPRRGFPLQIEPVCRHQQHHAFQPADGRVQHAIEQRAGAEIGRRIRRRG